MNAFISKTKTKILELSKTRDVSRSLLVAVGFLMACSAFAAGNNAGVSGISQAATTISEYRDPVQKLIYAIAAVIGIVGAFNVYFKMQNGDQDVKKTIMMTLGGCVALFCLAQCIPLFFQ